MSCPSRKCPTVAPTMPKKYCLYLSPCLLIKPSKTKQAVSELYIVCNVLIEPSVILQVFVLLFIFVKRQIMRFAMKSRRGPHVPLGHNAPKVSNPKYNLCLLEEILWNHICHSPLLFRHKIIFKTFWLTIHFRLYLQDCMDIYIHTSLWCFLLHTSM